jgi:hypothetical protein
MHNFTPKGWRHIQLYKNIYKLNNVHKLNKQRHSNNIQTYLVKIRVLVEGLLQWNDFHIFQRWRIFFLFFFRLSTLGSIITKQGFGAIVGVFSTKCFKFYLYLPITLFFASKSRAYSLQPTWIGHSYLIW